MSRVLPVAACLVGLFACESVGVRPPSVENEDFDGGEALGLELHRDWTPDLGEAAERSPLDLGWEEPPRPDAEVQDEGFAPEPEVTQLVVKYLGQGGFSLSYRGEHLLTAPMYSNPALSAVLTGTIAANPVAIDRFLGADADQARAILVGHAHYDHLMDVPWVWEKTNSVPIYGTLDTKRVLAAYAPDRPAQCSSAPADRPQIPREKVIALNDPLDDRVDYRMCAEPESDCTGAYDGRPGTWIEVPNSPRIRIRALCSSHAPQFLSFHFGAGCVDEDLCDAPSRAADWREGGTLAYLIDFMSLDGTRVLHRIYYQDAPTEAPVGFVSPDLLAEKRVDVALLCVGGFDQVEGHPQSIIEALNPRFVIAGHWESLFRAPDRSVQKIPFLDVDEFERRMLATMPAGTAWMPNPGTQLELPPE